MGAHRRKWLLVVLGACVVIALNTPRPAGTGMVSWMARGNGIDDCVRAG